MVFIAHRFPYPPDKGERIRAWNLLQHLSRTWRIHLGCLSDDPADAAHLDTLRTVCASVGSFAIDRGRQKWRSLLRLRPGRPLMLDYYGSTALQAWVDQALEREPIDLAYIYSAAMAPYVLPPRGPARPRLILDMQDIDSEKWADYARDSRGPMRLVWAREARTLLAYERAAAMECERTLFVSEPEARHFAGLAPESADRCTWVENGVDLQRFSPGLGFDTPYATPGPHLVFVGNMDYRPNAEAVAWFATGVLPLLRTRPAPPEFHIVGANPGPDVQRLAALAGVHVTGRVADVRPWVAHAAVSVCPLRMARGIQNKVLEAMALGRPVVASPQAYEGVRAEAGRDLLVADGAAAFAEAVGAVLDGRHPGLSANGRRAVESFHAWSATLARLDLLLGREEHGHNRHEHPDRTTA